MSVLKMARVLMLYGLLGNGTCMKYHHKRGISMSQAVREMYAALTSIP